MGSILRTITRNDEARKHGYMNRKGAYYNMKYAAEKERQEKAAQKHTQSRQAKKAKTIIKQRKQKGISGLIHSIKNIFTQTGKK